MSWGVINYPKDPWFSCCLSGFSWHRTWSFPTQHVLVSTPQGCRLLCRGRQHGGAAKTLGGQVVEPPNDGIQEPNEKPQSCVWMTCGTSSISLQLFTVFIYYSLLLKVKAVACVVCCVELGKGWLKSRIALKLKGWNPPKALKFWSRLVHNGCC